VLHLHLFEVPADGSCLPLPPSFPQAEEDQEAYDNDHDWSSAGGCIHGRLV
jgi:hypothetical protein